MGESEHYIEIDDYKRQLIIKYKDKIIASTKAAKILKEKGKHIYNPIFYIPKNDLKIELEKEEHKTSYCPVKGEATYWKTSAIRERTKADYLAWSYETPLKSAEKIKGLIAFDIELLTIISAPQ